MDKWTQIEFFVRVAETGSLTRAAERLSMSSAAATRCLTALEERVGARLVERTTRRLWLTEVGRAYYQRCAAMLAEMEDAEAAISEVSANPRGVLRVTASVSFAMMHIAPALPEFHRRYPDLAVDLITANRYPEFIEAGIDVAIRTREFESDSSITVRKLAETRRVLAASPDYLARHGVPMKPEALLDHQLLAYSLANDAGALQFQRGKLQETIPVKGILQSNEGQVIRAAALAGHGILIQPLYIIHDDFVAGRLIPVLTDWQLPSLTINIAFQSRRYQPAKIRVFIDFLFERFESLGMARKWQSLS